MANWFCSVFNVVCVVNVCPRCRSESIDSVWVAIVPGQKCIKKDISPDVDTITKLIICIDSNRKYLDHRLFLRDVNRFVDGKKYSNLPAALISCGTNDIDTKTGSVVAGKLLATTNRIKQVYPYVKMILNDVTPRTDNLDNEDQG